MKGFAVACLSLCLSLPGLARAAEPQSCKLVHFSDVGWTDITMTTATTRIVLGALGYVTKAKRLSVPATYKELSEGKLDIFLGNWMPAQENDLKPYLANNSIDSLGVNLQGAKYTLAVTAPAYEAGVRTFADLAKHADQFDSKLYGIEPGNDGNKLLTDMIAKNSFGLGKFQVVESSEQGMLAHVLRAQHLNKWIVFLGWAPHPMNNRVKMHYLDGGDEFFGPNFGGATVYTTVRAGYARECPNVGQFLGNLVFNVEMENQLMDAVLNEHVNRRQAAKAWLKANPQVLDGWLAGVTTYDGQPGLEAVKAKLGL
ncbi:MAG: choline ABC transporter substrate-binding protein [Pseudomonas sp.]|uniref:choline ABC transporter substrate-binding protein n=1 Tax=Pseudomonas sp. TaxID=306 RepID=UPI0033967B65